MVAPVEPIVISQSVSVEIAVDAQLSSVGQLGERRLLGVIIPAATEGTAITFQGSVDGENYYVVYDKDGVLSYDFTDPGYLAVEPEKFLGLCFLKVDTGTNQADAVATLTLVIG